MYCANAIGYIRKIILMQLDVTNETFSRIYGYTEREILSLIFARVQFVNYAHAGLFSSLTRNGFLLDRLRL